MTETLGECEVVGGGLGAGADAAGWFDFALEPAEAGCPWAGSLWLWAGAGRFVGAWLLPKSE